MSERPWLLMLSAMYENGGNTTQRLLDGHPQLLVYPFESQLGTHLVHDALSAAFPKKYRWPLFALHATPREDFFAIIDEECRVRARTPHVSKFRHAPFDFSDDDRARAYERIVTERGRTRGGNVTAFFEATFEAWRDYRRPPEPRAYVGYSPIIVVDAAAILADLPDAVVVHVVRNPWSAYADTKRRPVPMALRDYVLGWCLNQHHALVARDRNPGRVHILRFEDLVEDPARVLGSLLRSIGLDASPSLGSASFNGAALPEVAPWGTIRVPTPEANFRTMAELSANEKAEIGVQAGLFVDAFDYRGIV
jgi:hypothetical protein